MTTLRAEIGGMDLDDTLSNRETLNAKLQTELGSANKLGNKSNKSWNSWYFSTSF